MPAPSFLAGLPKPVLFGLYGAVGGLLGAVVLGEPAWQLLKPPLAEPSPQLAVAVSKSVKLYPGSHNTFKIQITRERFDDAVTVTFGTPPSGVTLPAVTVPAGATAAEATVTTAPDAAPGAATVTVTATALDGVLTAPSTIEVDVIAPPPALALTVSPNLVVYTQGEGKFTASIARRGYADDVAVHIDDLPDGVTMVPATIPRDQNEVEVTLKSTLTTPLEARKLTVVAEATPEGLRSAGLPAASPLKDTATTNLDVQTPPYAPVDLFFVLDVTGSMDWAINGIRDGIGTVVGKIRDKKIDYRIGLLAFRDLTIDRDPFPAMDLLKFDGKPFTTDVNAFRDKVSVLKATGGGDIPESSLEAVENACGQPFRKGATKVLLLITDAPPKVTPGQNMPQTAEEELDGAKKTALVVKANGIDAVNLVVQPADLPTYKPLMDAGVLKDGGLYFNLRDTVDRGDAGFWALLDKFTTAVVAAARARSSDVKPQVAPPPAPPKVGDVGSFNAAEAPAPPAVQSVQASEKYASGTQGRVILATGVWSGAIAALMCLALLSGQTHYLRGGFPSIARAFAGCAGGLVVGIVGGAAGQGLYSLSYVTFFQVLGWALLGGLAGAGLSMFIPNLKWVYGLAGGALGGAVGGLGYMGVAAVTSDVVGRISGGLIVGFFIGLMVAIVEAAFRRAWLEVRYGTRETIAVNLGPEPVKVGGDAALCTVWARGSAPVALRFFLRDGQVICDDATAKRESAVGDGYSKEVGNVTVTVRMGSSMHAPLAAQPVRPIVPPRLATTGPAKPAMLEDDFDFAPVAKSPPFPSPASQPTAPAGSRPVAPPVPTPAAPAPKPPTRPAAPPIPTAAKPPAPVPPKPPPSPPVASPPASAKHPDACPGCGRINPGRPRARYCMVCDQTY